MMRGTGSRGLLCCQPASPQRRQCPAGAGWLVGAAAESILAVLSCLRCRSFLPRREPTAARPLGVVDEDAEAGKATVLPSS